jgi:hypothetical protein
MPKKFVTLSEDRDTLMFVIWRISGFAFMSRRETS